MLNSTTSSSFLIIESFIRMLMYLAIISFAFKGVQALNIYIDKNTKQ